MSSSLDKYALPGLVTMAGIAQCGMMAKMVGKARGEHNVPVPETNGPPAFNRIFRAQQNHLEFYPLALGSLWMGSVFLHPVPSSLVYAGYLFGRHKYFVGYAEKAEDRIKPFMMSTKLLRLLILLGFIGVGHRLLRQYTDIDILEKIQEALPQLD